MRELKKQKTVTRLSLVLVLALATAGCTVPSMSLPKMPNLWGDKKVEGESWRETSNRRKAERDAKERAEEEGRDYVSEDTLGGDYQDERDVFADDRRDTASTGPAGISPYAENISPARRSPTSAVEMDGSNREPARRMEAAPRPAAEPLTAEQIGQMASISKNARRPTRSLNDVQAQLRGGDRIYTPRGQAPYPTVLFFHGCSGPTLTHERDWANFYTAQGYAMLAIDSYAGRTTKWQDVCNMQTLNPAERAADVLATVRYARTLAIVDPDKMILTGFSHGAATVWATLLLASGDTAPIGIKNYPRDGLLGVKAAYMFYGPCLAPWTVDVSGISFLGENDRFIDERDCARSARHASISGVDFDYEIYPAATHTFDHRQPNQTNKEAGSIYDRKATEMAQARIKEHLARHVKK